MTYPVKHISVTIDKPFTKVYEFTSNPENIPKWAEGLASSTLEKSVDNWITESPMGIIKVKFAPHNSYGVMDHDVTLPSGEVNHNPFRVFSNGEGSEVVFSLFHLSRMSEEDYRYDSERVLKDLLKLKQILEVEN